MIGAGKIGKSEFWAQGEKTLFLELEPGLNHLSVMKVPCRSWADIGEIYGELFKLSKANGTSVFPYDTIVIDTVDKLVARGNEEVIARAKDHFSKIADTIHSIADIPNGSGWAWATDLISNAIDKFERLPAAIVLIGHVSTKEIQEATRKYNKDTISIGGQTGTRFIHWADHTLHVRARMVGDNIQRNIRTKPTEALEAGSRGNVVPDGMVWGPDAKENYKAFRGLFT